MSSTFEREMGLRPPVGAEGLLRKRSDKRGLELGQGHFGKGVCTRVANCWGSRVRCGTQALHSQPPHL